MYRSVLLLILACPFLVGQAHAVTIPFGCITNNSGICSSIASLMSLDVTDEGGGETLFKFSVASGPNAAIKEIYFDDSLDLLNEATAVLDETGGTAAGGFVDFQAIASPGDNFPAGNTISFTESFSTEAVPASGDDKNGIDNGEWLGISFFSTDFSAIIAALFSNELRVGIHVGSINPDNDDESESMVSVIPVPAAFWLFGTALIGFIGMSRRRSV